MMCSWVTPNAQYENALNNFVEQVVKDPEFLNNFLPFQSEISFYGKLNSLSQTILKLTLPGVPDVYEMSQGKNDQLLSTST